MSFTQSSTPNNVPGSVTNWIETLREDGPDQLVIHEIWNRYFRRLASVARKHLSPAGRRVVDEEDVALSVLNSFFAKLDEGRFPLLADRSQLWTLLTTMATYRAMNARAKEHAQKRGGGRVRGDSSLPGDSWRELAVAEPGPQEVAAFKELVSHCLAKLDPVLRQIAHQKLLGKSDAEIAEQLEVSPRTVHRKLTRVRTAWQAEFE